MHKNTRLFGSIIIVILVAGFVEFMAYVSSTYLIKYPVAFTPLHITESYESYLNRYLQHPRVAWRSNVFDDNGNYRDLAKPSPVLSAQSQSQTPAGVSLYGDSFTVGFGVKPENSWGFRLSQLLQCRVANFGVSGYGTDQAYIRFANNDRDQAKVVILGFLSENLMRNVNQLRNLISASTVCFLKPRFILNNQGQLTLVPLPHLTEKEYDTLKTDPGRILHHEFFLPGGPSGYQEMEFPYTWGFLKAFPLIFKNVVLHEGTYYYLYRPGNSSQAVQITLAIMEAFYREARQRGQQPLILVIPTHIDLAYFRRHGTWIYHPITAYLAQKGLDFTDVGPRFIHVVGESGVETLYNPKTMYHLNDRGNEVLAKIVSNYLIQKKFNFGSTREAASRQ
jgi:hypothetical protein